MKGVKPEMEFRTKCWKEEKEEEEKCDIYTNLSLTVGHVIECPHSGTCYDELN